VGVHILGIQQLFDFEMPVCQIETQVESLQSMLLQGDLQIQLLHVGIQNHEEGSAIGPRIGEIIELQAMWFRVLTGPGQQGLLHPVARMTLD